MEIEVFNQKLVEFISASPTPFHAVAEVKKQLLEDGFRELKESDGWNVKAGEKCFLTRNDSSIIAFIVPDENQGMAMVGAHTDSPCLRVKPNPEVNSQGYFQLGVEVYGGVLLNPWFDRDLSLAGRVTYLTQLGHIEECLIDFARPIAVIPSLAIHLDREVNNSRSINMQKDIPPVLMRTDNDKTDFRLLLRQEIRKQKKELSVDRVLDYELSFYDTQPPAIVGLEGDFITSARLDNLLSCFIGLQALLDAKQQKPALIVFNDHEEVGSQSAEGAQGPFLKSVLERLTGSAERYAQLIDKSLMISADNAHGIHPNFTDRHDNKHGPKFHDGPVIKINSNQRYASNSQTSGCFRRLCEFSGVPCQSFVVRTDMACGSTIGPLTAANLGVKTVDVGVPQFAMHSIREMASAKDSHALYRVLKTYFNDDLMI